MRVKVYPVEVEGGRIVLDAGSARREREREKESSCPSSTTSSGAIQARPPGPASRSIR
jgi:hypothetical protein